MMTRFHTHSRAAGLVAAFLILAPFSPALAHAHLRSAQPAVDGTVRTAVQDIRITFSEAVEPRFCQLTLTGPDGKTIETAAPQTDPADAKILSVHLAAKLAPGAYKVEWHATSVDTHKTDGKYGFTVAADGQAQGVDATRVWARATPPSASTGAIYMTLTSPAADKLTGASSPAAGTAQVHEMRMDGAVMRMREVEGGLDLPAGQPVTLRPGGLHLMLDHLKGPLKAGDTVSVHLTFAHAPPLDVTAIVQSIGAAGPADGHAGMTMSK